MLKTETIEWIKQLGREGRSRREISRRTSVARDTVAAVLAPDYEHSELSDTLYDVEDPIFTDPPSRCSGCGAIVYMPCLACSMRRPK